MRMLLRSVILTCLVFLVPVGIAVAPALAETPAWSIRSYAAPKNLHHGVGADEVQEVAVSATGGELFVIAEGLGTASLPWDATAKEMEEGLEGIYGKENVTVTGGPAAGEDCEDGCKPYVVTFTGKLAEQAVAPMNWSLSRFALSCAGATGSGCKKEAAVTQKVTGRPDGEIVVDVTNLGDMNASASASPIVVSDKLPPGLKVVSIGAGDRVGAETVGLSCNPSTVSCEGSDGDVEPYGLVEVHIGVSVGSEVASPSNAVNIASITGGGAQSALSGETVSFNSAPAGFGVEQLEQVATEGDGSLDTQAGSHPFGYTTTMQLNEGTSPLPKDLHFNLPPGLIGNPTVLPQCTFEQFSARVPGASDIPNPCPDDTALGVVTVWLGESGVDTVPVFNMVPAVGEPARFAFQVLGTPVVLDTSVRSGGDYGVTVSVNDISTELPFNASQLTLWGAPASPLHDDARGWNCLFNGFWAEGKLGPCPASSAGGVKSPPVLTLPTSCNGLLRSTVEADSWKEPGVFQPGEYTLHNSVGPVEMDGCNKLPFEPSIRVTPDGQAGSTPTGLNVDEHVPQQTTLNPEGLAESDVKGLSVTLPEGVVLNPAAADGLQACSEEQIALHSGEAPGCPESSKVATVKIKTPLLPNPLTGAAYLAVQDSNPFGSLVALYIETYDPISGIRAKGTGEVLENPVTGQLTAHFEHDPVFDGQSEASQFLPQVPFEDIELHFFGGERAPLATPPHCGAYMTTGTFTPWSGNPTSELSSTFDITSGPNGSACPGSTLPFNPSLTGGMTNINAGAFSPFTMTMSREDGQQNLKSIALHMPPGLLGTLTGIPLCGEAQADAGTCPAASLIGETTVSVGLGGDPFTVRGGQVFLTEKYGAAPFGLSIVNPAVAGPFNLGKIVIRAKLELNKTTAAVTVTSDSSGPYAIPPMIDGIPLQIKHVNVTINRGGGQGDFTFNPTNCNALAVTGTLQSIEGASQALSVPFQATNCAALKFTPGFAVSTSGKTSRSKGASLTVKVTRPSGPSSGQANFAMVKVDLPKQLPSRLTTLQKACTAAVFEANPAGCPAASIVGHVKVLTPLLPVPVEGPAYFVSHGGEAFPSLIFVLQGYGVTIDVVSTTFISRAGITSATLKTVPDVPFTSFELTLPEGKYSALAANGNLCKSKLAMPTAFVAQNGMTIHQTTPIKVNGCPPTRKKAKALTNKQKLAKALKACHKKKGSKRAQCEKAARKKFKKKK
jgi:hypothetical protein